MRSRISLPGLVLLGLLLAACSADPLNVVVLNARAPGEKCEFDDNTKYVEGGSVDFRPYVINGVTTFTGFYGQIFAWENNMQKVETTVNGQPVDNGNGNDFIADSVVYDYQYTDPNVVLAAETENIHAVITAGALAANNTVGASLIQPKASAAIGNSAGIDASAQTLLVTFQIFGNIVAGTSKHTNKVSFPVTVYRSSTTALDCASQALVINGGVCNIPGRDQVVSCKKP